MVNIVIHSLDDEMVSQLRLRAVAHGRSMEEEVRVILREAIEADAGPNSLEEAIRARFAPVRVMEPGLPQREPARPVQGRLKLE